MTKRRYRILLGAVAAGVVAVAVLVGPAWWASRSESRLRRAIESIEAELPAPDVPPARAQAGSDSEPSRFLQMDSWLETNFPPQAEPEALVDAPWNWGRNHPPIVFPYLAVMESFFAGVRSTLALPHEDFPEATPEDRVVSIRTTAAMRWSRLLVAEAWRLWVANGDVAGAAGMIADALELTRRLDAGTHAQHAVRVQAVTRAAVFIRFLVERAEFDPSQIRGRLEPALRGASEILFAPALARGVADYANAIESRALEVEPVGGEGSSWRRATRLRALRRALARVVQSVTIVADEYPRARVAMDAWLSDVAEPLPWIERRRLDPRALVRDWEPTVEARTQVALARVALALVEHASEQGAYPDSLDEIRGRFESGIPTDPRRGEPFVVEWLEGGGLRLVPAPARDLPPPYRADPPRYWDLPPLDP